MKTRLDVSLLVVAYSDLYYNHIIMFFHQFSASLHMHKILKIDRSSRLIIAGLQINYDFILNEPLTTSPVADGACGKGCQYTHRCQGLSRRDGV